MMGPKVNISGNTQPGSKKYKNPRTKNAKKNKKNKQLAMQGNSQEPEGKKRKLTTTLQGNQLNKQDEATVEISEIQQNTTEKGNSSDAFVHLVDSQLKIISPFQRIIAEKLIGDIIYYAKLGDLNKNTSINLNSRPQSHEHGSTASEVLPYHQSSSSSLSKSNSNNVPIKTERTHVHQTPI